MTEHFQKFVDFVRWLTPRRWLVTLAGCLVAGCLLAFPPWVAYLPEHLQLPLDETPIGRSFFMARPKPLGDCVRSETHMTSSMVRRGIRASYPRTVCVERTESIARVPLRFWRVRIDAARLAIEVLLVVVAAAAIHLSLARNPFKNLTIAPRSGPRPWWHYRIGALEDETWLEKATTVLFGCGLTLSVSMLVGLGVARLFAHLLALNTYPFENHRYFWWFVPLLLGGLINVFLVWILVRRIWGSGKQAGTTVTG